ncbi:heme-binding protein 1-like [Petromyzon marinus]|uniref:Heme-binding protein 1-like n=1 Tax=Petromyzon marinus TaxID=7757 RepID=A0AAJ7TQ04_PETMA|nr:heme-binding protein 1-like [Petromyzon marinus]XP_032820878.1 heme-binding protein 1-like [Petromyzon marinus]XP_032820879.1 heme-binding protein 1-like [Petromyzon marinus]XP_032820880.1 heme-binding protein 1-like [Petromyzon marinus]
MEQDSCRFGGGSGMVGGQARAMPGQPHAGQLLITMDDLDTMSEETKEGSNCTSGEGVDNASGLMDNRSNEAMEERLFNYWEDIARTHQVVVPREMAQPIQQMSMNNHPETRELNPYTVIQRNETGDSRMPVEEREYPAGWWACVTTKEDTYEQSICYAFMKIMRYICRDNSTGSYLGMTIPIVTTVQVDEATGTLFHHVVVGYRLPVHLQGEPPTPFDPTVSIEERPAMRVYTREFSGATNETTIMRQVNELTQILGPSELYNTETHFIAAYNNPAAANRRNEIWFIRRI